MTISDEQAKQFAADAEHMARKRVSSDTPSNVCEHGSLRRKCPHCENAQLERELDAMTARAQADEARELLRRIKDDLSMRAERAPDGDSVVAVGNSIWRDLCAYLARTGGKGGDEMTDHTQSPPMRDRNRDRSDTPNNDLVICPQCCHQFRAIPVNVQADLAAMTARAERLREALQNITAIQNKMVGPDWEEIDEARHIAQQALEGK